MIALALTLIAIYAISVAFWCRWLRRTFGHQLANFEPPVVTFGLFIAALCWPLVWFWVAVRVRKNRRDKR